MDPNDLLATTRAEFMRAFIAAVQKTLPRSIEELFGKADLSHSSSEQGRYLNARSVLQDKGEVFVQQMGNSMEHLLNRSFQTTYNTFRPSSALDGNADNLSLIDSSAFEDELRINDITKRFRSEAEEQLRDLNIRVALLFEQDTIKERENPFRPYLFSRCTATSIESFGLSPELSAVLLEQLAANFASFVAGIYKDVNTHLAQNGVAAQLQFKIKKSPTSVAGDALPEETSGEESEEQIFQHGRARMNAATYDIGGKQYNVDARALSVDTPKRRMEQLFDSVRGMASGLSGGNAAATQGSSVPRSAGYAHDHESASEPTSQSKFGWLSGGQAVGSVLRKFFSNGSASPEERAAAAGFRHSGTHGPQPTSASGHAPDTSVSANHFAQSGHYSSTGHAAHPANQAADQSALHNGQAIPDSGDATNSSALTRSLQGMQRAQTPATTEMLDGRGEVRNLILEQRSALNEMTKDVDEQMTIDIVAMLFEFILRDSQVPAEIRAQLGRLQFLVLKLALRDTSLLTQKGHPARMLVNRIGSISLGLKQLDPTGAHITAEICRIVEVLLHDESESVVLFAKMLDEFDVFIAQELRASDKNIERTIDAVEQVQNRTLRFVHTAAQLAEALLGLTIDGYLKAFLENTWVHAIEQAERKDAKRARRYRLLVPDLLWSIIPKLKEDDKTQLFALLPVILTTLREGLALIKWDPAAQQTLLNWLVDAHTSALRASHSQTVAQVPTLSAIHQHFDNFVSNPEATEEEVNEYKDLAKNQQYLDQAIKELDLKVQMLDQVFDQELPHESKDILLRDSQIELTPALIQERLRSGIALEINVGGKPSLGRLNWVNPNLSNLVLSLEGQDEPSMVSVRMFQRMMNHGHVRFMEKEPLFERAVQSLLLSADQMDKSLSA
ncbi:DUF1631 domain-containing protein [Undibacterium sp. Jales W-56]|uniref:DUF1631 domain-containing protein n=1 Tax=Undibacterium sp. Jales W-56 TaxID=2897325 RepID=UPI0021D15182|nr:DUF1631 domain-containing protein [Undibacterium sp. Jales W-56]MCU6434436.1 DUF1631 domain-containing protein [Undibacterium sp. Jales W-56]